jgi:hypothetical protein
MAGGWGEVVAVSSGIRTGVELNKKGEAHKAAEILAGRTRPLKAKNWRAGPLLNKQTVFG